MIPIGCFHVASMIDSPVFRGKSSGACLSLLLATFVGKNGPGLKSRLEPGSSNMRVPLYPKLPQVFHRGNVGFWDETLWCKLVQGGPLPVINGVITSINGLING